ncbi:MFS transporter [Spirosoma sp. KUDC1026]|uniref:MFS transporter n=1 Tax=Spirosoma sp. KUDC1026 TaxID=2745947 RepID=UPI00159BE6F4|nr:MFS transporter [Spirosoma sp. KUDC1026]QKZ14568.1 MFS transporter [Spirosoma sp. KUDC1026]
MPSSLPVLSQSRSLRYGTFLYLYIMQGIPSGFALTAVTNYLTAEGLTPQALGTFGAVVGLPWGFKFVWGPLVDRFQSSRMGRRRPWVLGAQCFALLASLGILLVGDPVREFTALALAFACHGVFASLQDVSVDALAITISPVSERGRINGFMKCGMVMGQAIGAAGLAYLIRSHGFHTAALIQSAILLFFTIITFFIREQPDDSFLSVRRYVRNDAHVTTLPDSFGPLLRNLLQAVVTRQNLVIFGAIALVFISERLFQRAYFIHLIRFEGWSDTSVSVLSGTYGTLLAVLLALLGGWLADAIGAQRMLVGITLLMATLHIGFSVLAPFWSNDGIATTGLVVRQTLEPIFSIVALPTLMGLCRRGIEGAQFAFYMALSNQADVIGIFLAGQLQPFFSAPVLGMACGVAMVLAMLLLRSTLRRSGLQAAAVQ